MKNLDKLRSALAHEGLRFTHQREAVWNEILSNDDHRDAEDIYIALRKNGFSVSRATVYRTIDVLVKNNMVRKLNVGFGSSKFEHKTDPDHHDHIICIQCEKIEEFMDVEIEATQVKIAEAHGFELVNHAHQLFGICKDCQ